MPMISKCLHSLAAQTYPRLEVVIVDKNSNDGIETVGSHFGAKVVFGGRERSEQCNIGAKLSAGEIIWRTDADFVFDPIIVSEAVKCIGKGFDAVVVNGSTDEDVSVWSETRARERACFVGDWAHTAACFVTRAAFFAVGGFDERLNAFEDYDLHNRLLKSGYRIGRIDAKAYHLGEPKSLSEIVGKYAYYGERRNILSFSKENPGKGMWQLMPIRLVYLRNLRGFGLYFFPFMVYHYVKYASALVGFVAR